MIILTNHLRFLMKILGHSKKKIHFFYLPLITLGS